MLKPTPKQQQGVNILRKRILNKEPISVFQGVAGSG